MTPLDTVDLLIVEDSPSDLELTMRALRKANIANTFKVVRDGAEALDFLFSRGAYADRVSGQVPRLILLDLKLPKVDGKEVLRQLRSNARTKMIPVVMLTSSQQERDIQESYSLGANSYIVKPVDFSKFTEAISNLGMYWLLLNQPSR